MKEVLKLALEALEADELDMVDDGGGNMVFRKEQAITAIKEALSGCQCPECQVVLHASDCAVHSGPAYPAGGCDCGAQPEQEPMHPELRKMWEDYFDKCFRRQPLTDKQILADETLRYYFGQNGGAGPVSKQGRKVVNAIEALHGIKEVKSCGS